MKNLQGDYNNIFNQIDFENLANWLLPRLNIAKNWNRENLNISSVFQSSLIFHLTISLQLLARLKNEIFGKFYKRLNKNILKNPKPSLTFSKGKNINNTLKFKFLKLLI